MKKLFTSLLLIGLICSNSAFAVIYLVENGTGSSTWRTAGAGEVNVVLSGTSLNAWYTTATIAVGDQVWIKNGTYVLTGSITPKGGESIYGGFAGTETAISQRVKGTNAWDFTNATVLDGNNAVAVFLGAASTANPTIIGGLTIANGTTSTSFTAGGALLNANTTMENCIATLCKTTLASNQSAGGIFVSASAMLRNSLISYNTSANAAGGVNVLPGGEVDGCTIDHNTADQNAGGIYLNASSGGDGAKVSNCIITYNQAKGTAANTGNGGGLMIYQTNVLNTPVTVTNCTISNNSTIATQGQGAGVMINEGGTPTPNNTYTFINCTVSNNSAFKNGGGFNLKATGVYNINNCRVEGNTTANVSGGGLNIAGGTLTLNNTIFKNNSSGVTTTGGAINANPVGFTANNCLFYGNTGNSVIQFQSTSDFFTMNNCTVALNFKSDGTTATGVNVNSPAACQITNSLFLGCGNTPIFVTSGKAQPNVNYCGFEAATATNVDAYTGKVGNIFSISSAAFQNPATGDYSLASGSTAIDAGTTIAGITTGITGVSRPQWFSYDMGAYEYNLYTWTGDNVWSSTTNWSPAILPNSTSSILVNSGILTQDQNATLKSLTINTGATLNIAADKALTVASDLTNNGTVNLLSNASGTATLMTNGVVSTGNYNVKQDLNVYRSWYMSSPVASATPAGMNRIKHYNEADNTWPTLFDISGTPYGANSFVNGKGYIVVPDNDDTEIQFTGNINNGNVSVAVSNNAVTNPTKAGYNLVGNPYPSYLDWTKVYAANSSVLANSTMWYRTKVGATYYFWTVNGDGVGSVAEATKNIPPMQGFWVKASTNGSFNFSNAMRIEAPATNKLIKAPAKINANRTLIRLQVSNGTNVDQTVIYFSDNASNGLDVYDAPKMSNENVLIPEIYTTVANQQMVINGMNSIVMDQPIALGFVAGNATNFSIKANELANLPSDVKIILKDNVTQLETDLTDGTNSYEFSNVSSSTDRFSIIFRAAGVTTNVNKVLDNSVIVYANANNNIVLINNEERNVGAMVSVFNTVGQKLYGEKLAGNSLEIKADFNPGVYFVKVNNLSKKVIIK